MNHRNSKESLSSLTHGIVGTTEGFGDRMNDGAQRTDVTISLRSSKGMRHHAFNQNAITHLGRRGADEASPLAAAEESFMVHLIRYGFWRSQRRRCYVGRSAAQRRRNIGSSEAIGASAFLNDDVNLNNAETSRLLRCLFFFLFQHVFVVTPQRPLLLPWASFVGMLLLSTRPSMEQPIVPRDSPRFLAVDSEALTVYDQLGFCPEIYAHCESIMLCIFPPLHGEVASA